MNWAKPAISIKVGPSPDTEKDHMRTAAVNSDILSSYESSVNKQCVYDDEGTPKCRSKKRTLKESMNDKENIPAKDTSSTVSCAEKEVSKPPAKRMLLERDTTGKKNSKSKVTGKARSTKKQIALLQGQRQLTNFFR